jgi:hypothetical protein
MAKGGSGAFRWGGMGKNKDKESDVVETSAIEDATDVPEPQEQATAIESELQQARSHLTAARMATEAAASVLQERQAEEAASLQAYDQMAERARQHYVAERLRLEEHLRSVQGELAALDSKLSPIEEGASVHVDPIAPMTPIAEVPATSSMNGEVVPAAVSEPQVDEEALPVVEVAPPTVVESEATVEPDATSEPGPAVEQDDATSYEDEWYQRMKRQSELERAEGSW